MQKNCIACGSGPLVSLGLSENLSGTTFRADRLYPFSLLQCRNCGHIQKALDAGWKRCMHNLYEQDYKDVLRQINFVDGKVLTRDSAAVALLIDLMQLADSGRLLDIGCGTGTFLTAFSAEKPGWTVAGQDVSSLNRDRILQIKGAEFYEGPLENVGGKFNVITLNHVLEHLTAPIDVLRSAANLLEPGGVIVGRVPSFLAVHTDFYLLEHCSHFTRQTLGTLAAMAGLSIVQEISPAPIEIGFVAIRSEGRPNVTRDGTAADNALQCLSWAKSLPEFVRTHAKGRRAGIFGVGGAGIWLGAALRGVISFYVDDDPSKQGHRFAGCPIVSARDIPDGAVVFVTFNSPEASQRICQRLRSENPKVEFMAP